jgi:hypothetical protein
LNSYIEASVFGLANLRGGRRSELGPGEHFLHFLDEAEEVGHFVFGEVRHTTDFSEGDY